VLTVRVFHLVIAVLALLAFIIVLSAKNQSAEEMPASVNQSYDPASEQRLLRIEATLSELKTAVLNARNRRDAQPEANSEPDLRPTEGFQKHDQEQAIEDGTLPTDELGERRQLARSDALEALMRSEKADPTWSLAAAEEVSTGLPASTTEQTQLGEVRCLSTLCRVEATHAPGAEDAFMIQLTQLTAFRNSEAYVTRAPLHDGRIATTIYVSRSDHDLPNEEM